MLFTLDKLMRFLSVLVSPGPNQPREMDNLEQRHLPPTCDSGPLFWRLSCILYWHSSSIYAGVSLLVFIFWSVFFFPPIHIPIRNGTRPRDRQIPFSSSHCSWPQGADAALQCCLCEFCGFHIPTINCKNMRSLVFLRWKPCSSPPFN